MCQSMDRSIIISHNITTVLRLNFVRRRRCLCRCFHRAICLQFSIVQRTCTQAIQVKLMLYTVESFVPNLRIDLTASHCKNK